MTSTFTPREMRKKFAHTGGKDQEKQKAFRRAALWSKRFIHQSASLLEGDPEYARWCKQADGGVLRRGR